MAPINPEVLAKIQSKLNVTQNHAYKLIAEKVKATYLPRHLAAVALASDLGININKAAYATDQERFQISAARTGGTPQSGSSAGDASSRQTKGAKPKRRPAVPKRKSNSVMVVHGRNIPIRDALYEFLRALGLNPIEFSQGVRATRKGAPAIKEVLDAMFAKAAAVVVLLTPDDEARLRKEFIKPSDPAFERKLTGQARPNVLFEAGRAFGSHPRTTILVQVGNHRQLSDLAGVHFIDLGDDPASRHALASRLETAGCAVDRSGVDWLKAGRFAGARGQR